MAVESEEILSKISDLINSKVDELSTNLNNFRQEASNNNQTLENAIGSIKSVIDEKLSKIDQISSEINSIQTSVQSVADTVSATNNKIDNILSQQTQLQRTVDSVSQNIEKLSTVTSNQLTYLSNQSQNITEKIDKLSLQQEREARTAAVESATGKTVSGAAADDATEDGEETKRSLIGSVLSGIKGILTSPIALGAALGAALPVAKATGLLGESPRTPQAGSDAEFNLPRDTSGNRRTGGQREPGPQPDTSGRGRTGGQREPGPQPTIKKGMVPLDELKKALETTSREYRPIPPKVGPASIRYKNPGASWDRSRDKLFGLQGYGILVDPRTGERNRIGRYSNPTLGLASNMDVMNKRFVNRTLQQATNIWRGRRSPAPKFKLSDGTEIGPNTTITPELLNNKEFMNKLFRKFAGHESGRKGTLSDEQISQAFDIYRAGGLRNYIEKVEKGEIRPPTQPSDTTPREDVAPETETASQPDASREQTGDRRSDGSFQYRAPVTGTVVGGRRSHFGAPRSGGRRLHSGNDFQAKNGSPVTATLNGQVVHVGNHSGYGWTIDIRHPDGNVHRYATHGVNPARFGIEKGKKVEAGQQIGTIGRGHLHYEIIDPNYYDRVQKRNNGGFVPTSRVPGRNPSVLDPSKVIGVPHGTRITGGNPYKPPEQNDSTSPETEQQRIKDAIEQETFDFRDLPSTDRLMKLGASDVEPLKEPANDPYEQFKGSTDWRGNPVYPNPSPTIDKTMKELMEQSKMLQSMDDVDLTPPNTKSEMEKYLDGILKRARNVEEEAKKQAQQAQPQSQKVLGNLTGPEFFDPRTLKKFDENTKRDNTGVNSAPPPPHKKPDLNEIYT